MVPLNDLAITVLKWQMGKQCEYVFTYAGRPIGQVNTKHWRDALKRGRHRRFLLARPAAYLGKLAPAK